jgi:hypothetical protein
MTQNIGAHIESVARHYWGEPTSAKRNELRWGTFGSRSVDLRKGTWFDHEAQEGGGVIDLVKREEGASLTPVSDVLQKKFGIDKKVQERIKPASYISKAFDYCDDEGVVRYQVLRYEPKTFRQRHQNDKGEWVWNMDGVEALPYRLPDLLASPDKPIYIVEGEQCAEKLFAMGRLATCNHGGAGNWKAELNKWFVGRKVVVLPDNDDAGRAHASKVVNGLLGIAAEVRQVELPGLPEKGDVVDWLLAGNTMEELRDLVVAADRIENLETVEDVEPEFRGDVFETYSLLRLRSMPPIEWMIESIIPQNSLSVMYGEPGAGKSFLALDMALSVAYGRPWHGKAVMPGSILYIAGEGVGGLGKRVAAWQAFYGVDPVAPFHVLPTAVRFREPEDVEKLMRTIDSFNTQFSCVFVDTVARALLGGDENSATDMGMFIDACDAVKRHAKCALMGIHHSGKDAARGMRGSTALLGAVETSIRVTRSDDILSMKMEKQKDADPCEDINFNMEQIAIIGDASIVLEACDAPTKKKRQKLSPSQSIALECLRGLVIDLGSKSIPIHLWQEAHSRAAPDAAASTKSSARSQLQEKGIVGISKDIVTEL